MNRPQGYLIITSPDAPVIEHDTATCRHCSAVVFVKAGTGATVYVIYEAGKPPREEPGAFCMNCMGPVCLACDAHGRCLPLERRLEQMEARDRLMRAVGIG